MVVVTKTFAIKPGSVGRAFSHLSHSAFAGMLLLTFFIGHEISVEAVEGSAMYAVLALLVYSLMVVGKAALSFVITWLITRWVSKPLPLRPVRLYWILWTVIWFLTLGGVM
jgi:hypothetical protein